ncbi:MAG: PilW family protein, partial [Vicinamibacteria bacterium]
MRNARQERIIVAPERGFSLIEVMISMLVTMIVMAAVFGLLTRGQRSFQREPEIADLQQSARTVLDMVSKDILQTGAGLPPEFPAFSRINGAGDANPTDVIEVIGTFQSAGNVFLEPEDVASALNSDVALRANTTNLEINDMVALYNNVTNNDPTRDPQWALARVTNVVEDPGNPAGQAVVTLDYGAFDAQYSSYLPAVGGPPDPASFATVVPVQMPKITRVSVVRYFTQPDDPTRYAGPPPQVLMRDVDFAGQPQAVGYLEDFQIRYVIGVTAPVEQDNPPNAVADSPETIL